MLTKKYEQLDHRILTVESRPSNVFVTDEPDAFTAYVQCKNALSQGFNAAVWNYPALTVTEELVHEAVLFADFYEEYKDHDEAELSVLGRNLSHDAMNIFSSDLYNDVKRIALDHKLDLTSLYPKTLIKHLCDTFNPLSSAFNGGTLQFNVKVDTLDKYRLDPHIDPREYDLTKLNGWPHNPEAELTVLSTYSGLGTIILDRDEYDMAIETTYSNGWKSYAENQIQQLVKRPTAWSAMPFAVAFIACSPFPVAPALHSWPIRKYDDNTNRLKSHSSLRYKP